MSGNTVIGPGQPTEVRENAPTQAGVIAFWNNFREMMRHQTSVAEGKAQEQNESWVAGEVTHQHISHDLRSGYRR